MWIAKPIAQLSVKEQIQWEEIPGRPLSQTLAWARAIDSISGSAYLIFSPDERVGGIVFGMPLSPHSLDFSESKTQFECINGPLLNWDNPREAPRQLATFALATSKAGINFHSLSLRPRWKHENVESRLNTLPIEAAEQTAASTLIIKLKPSKEERYKALSHRMRRTLATSWKNNIHTRWEKLSTHHLLEFVPAITAFGKSHGFITPPLGWFQRLTEESKFRTPFTPSFWLITSEKKEKGITLAFTQILISQMGTEAHYLFGYENRLPELRSAISTSATAHWEAMTHCAEMGIETYDLNGYIDEPRPEDPYLGVCEFKKQFAGEIVQYVVPEFRIK